jgi:tRNA(His) 5'-end guanylyltransferase
MSKDSLGDRMKDIESRTEYFLPRRTYTLLRFDGRSFHNFTRGCNEPFDFDLMRCMQFACLEICKAAQGCAIGYTQSDEISLVLTDFETPTTEAWFDGKLRKIESVGATIVANAFNKKWIQMKLRERENCYTPEFLEELKFAEFDCRVWTTSDPWEVFNTFLWRQQDASRNSIQMVAQSLYSHKELQNKDCNKLQEMIFQKGQNWNEYPTECRRGTFVYKNDSGWVIDKNGPILTQDRKWFFDKLPMIEQPKF